MIPREDKCLSHRFALLPTMFQKQKAAGYQRVTRLFDDMHDVCHSTVCRNQRSERLKANIALLKMWVAARQYTEDC